MEILRSLADTPLPHILVIGGLAFLFMSISGKIANIVVDPKKQKYAATIGVCLTLAGVVLFVMPHHTTAPATKEERKVQQLFVQLDSFDLSKVRSAAVQLIQDTTDEDNAKKLFQMLKDYLRLVRAPHDIMICLDESGHRRYDCSDQFYGHMKKEEEERVKNLVLIINNFSDRSRRKLLYEAILTNRLLWFGRTIAADELCRMEESGSYWKTLLDVKENQSFRQHVIDVLEQSSEPYADELLIWAALKKRDIQTLAIFALERRQSKSAVGPLESIMRDNSSDSYVYSVAYKALREIEPDRAQEFPLPSWPPSWSKPRPPAQPQPPPLPLPEGSQKDN